MVWRKFLNVPRHRLEMEDMVQAAMANVCHYAPRFDPDRSEWVPFALFVAATGVKDELRRVKFGSRYGEDIPIGSVNITVQGEDFQRIELQDTLEAKLRDPERRWLAWDLTLAMDTLTERERMVVEKNVLRGIPQRKVGMQLGVSESRICQIKQQALERLRNHPRIIPYIGEGLLE